MPSPEDVIQADCGAGSTEVGQSLTRREFLEASALLATTLIPGTATAQLPIPTRGKGSATPAQRLLTGWEYHAGSLGGIWEVWRGREISASHWQAVEMPHCFNVRDAVDPDEPYYQGPGWYRCRLSVANPYPAGRTLLHFEGAGQVTEVFVHLEKLTRHVGGYDEFTVDITDAVARLAESGNGRDAGTEGKGPPEVSIAVLCDNSRDLERIPSDLSDFTLYGGLYRYVNLIYVPAVSIERLHVETTVESSHRARAVIKVRLYNPSVLTEEATYRLTVLDPRGRAVHRVSRTSPPWNGEIQLFELDLDHPILWSPAQPALYHCELTAAGPGGECVVTERFGLRYFEFVQHGPFKLNGTRLLIRGTQRHEDHAGLGAAMPEDLIRQEMRMIKELGANFIRLGHYQQSRIVLDLCDELGILVWEEVPWCRGGLGGPAYRQQARDMLRNMIDQHYNHPSIILWGLGNENDWSGDSPQFHREDIRAFMTELNTLAHQLDPGRKTSIRRCDFARDIPDVYSPSIWMGWYRGQYTEYKSECLQQMQKVEHFLHMEWGGDSHPGRHSEAVDRVFLPASASPPPIGYDFHTGSATPNASRDGLWSETYICNLFDWCLKEQETMPWLTGAAQWAFKDFATPSRPQNPLPRVNQKGLVERDLRPKEGYYVFQSYWSPRPMIRIYGHSWLRRVGGAGKQQLVKVYSNCKTVELFLNGRSCGPRKRNSQDYPAAGLRWIVSFPVGENHLRAVGHGQGTTIEDELRFEYLTEPWGAPALLELTESSRTDDRVVVGVWARDEKRLACLDARQRVRFGIAGDGRLQDNLGTVRGSRVVELRDGWAEIAVLLPHGRSVISASAEGLPTAFLSLER
jgi:beta-galactosidase